MGWFSKKATAEETTSGLPPADDEVHPATDTLAAVVRTLGQHAVDLDAPDQEDFPTRCEAWARHLLLGTPAPIGDLPEVGSPEPRAVKVAYADLRKFVLERRTLEQRSLKEALQELRDILLGLMTRVRKSARQDALGAQLMADELAALKSAASQLTLAELKEQVKKSAEVIGEQLDAQTARRTGELKHLGQQVQQMRIELSKANVEARRDPLTGLDNRKVLDESLERYVALSEAAGEPLSAIMLDLDHFKKINDAYGHQGGDAVLKATAGVLIRGYLRKGDLLVRYGGEEFCVLLPSTHPQDALRLTEKVLDNLRRANIEYKGKTINVTGSAGIVGLQEAEPGLEMLERADQALYAAKQEGRDRAVLR
ncbi:MAG: GGDEF domain-containing protein [Deltaproteobacteria bacterium]|nr:GGDEF domain-containing protein [Deltaproteobacteria bacterium]